jgi:hypothetical protein
MLQRWKARQFGREERELAMDWRRAVGSMNLNEIYIRFRSRAASLRTLEDAYQAARHIVEDYEQRSVVMERALHLAGLRPDLRHVALERWKEQSTPPLAFHAPYTAYLVKLDVFFSLAIGAGLIGKERPSNIVDFAYLYYLPFCQILVSQDKLHRTLAPIVMEGKKEFVWTPDLKTDLARLDAHYSTFPEDVRRQGVRVFAQEPPKTGEWLVSRLWDRFLPKWRSAESALPGMSADQRARAAELARRIAEAPGSGDAAEAETGSQDSDFMLIKHVVPRRVGKWNLYPPDA